MDSFPFRMVWVKHHRDQGGGCSNVLLQMVCCRYWSEFWPFGALVGYFSLFPFRTDIDQNFLFFLPSFEVVVATHLLPFSRGGGKTTFGVVPVPFFWGFVHFCKVFHLLPSFEVVVATHLSPLSRGGKTIFGITLFLLWDLCIFFVIDVTPCFSLLL